MHPCFLPLNKRFNHLHTMIDLIYTHLHVYAIIILITLCFADNYGGQKDGRPSSSLL